MEHLSSLLGSLSLSSDKLQVLESVQPALGKLSRWVKLKRVGGILLIEHEHASCFRQELATGLAGKNIDLVPVFDCLASGQPEVGSKVEDRWIHNICIGTVICRFLEWIWYSMPYCQYGPQVERAGCEVLARLLGALDPVLVLER